MPKSLPVNTQQIKEILSRNVAEVVIKKELEAKLLSGKQLRIKLGIDPTGAYLTLGHMVVIRKLREFQIAGHQIVLLFGNFTAQIGDPTGKSATRKPLSVEQITENAKTYLDQVGKVLDLKKTEVVWNADWLGKFKFDDVLKLASNFTVAQMLERDMFQERIKKDQPIGLHEFLYPLMQGYDSVEIRADLELGGTDQLFNMLAARPLQKAANQPEQSVMTMKILVGTDGIKKMGKSDGNFIAVLDEPSEMFGKIMSIPDDIILNYFELCTNISLKELGEIEKRLKSGQNPRDIKIELAKNIVTTYHSEQAATQAAEQFSQVFSQGGVPDDLETIIINNSPKGLIELLLENKLVSSKGEAKRLIDGGGIKVDQKKVQDYNLQLDLTEEKLIQIGKRVFVKFKSV
ncbi:tyrosine--tRNA ligase [Candidatus Peregrinibacteria bacterium]|nr:tyrosine--tRNA ligase [Candidatus Peregrinibacteria bacterium]